VAAKRLWADAMISHRRTGEGESYETDLDQV
jgi:hypothetical protein